MAKVQTTVSDFEVLCTIGSGSYGVVKKVRRIKDKKILVWKELDYSSASDADKNMLVSEVNLLREFKHENIVRYVDRIIDRKASILYLVMEFCEGGDLASFIARKRKESTPIEESFIWRVCIGLASALRECHSRCKYGRSVLHRDLKPANIFLDSKFKVKLGDFGLARVLKHDASFAKTCVGTPLYMSPEQISGQEYNEKTDMWALGCLLYELCCLKPPFLAANQRDLACKIKTGCYDSIQEVYSTELRCLIGCLINVKKDERPSIDVVLDQAKRKLFTQVNPKPTPPQPVHPKSPSPQLVPPKPTPPQLVPPKAPSPQPVHPKAPPPQPVHPKSPPPQPVHPKSPSPQPVHQHPTTTNVDIESLRKENERLRRELNSKEVELKKLKMKHFEVEALCKELEDRMCQLDAREQNIRTIEKLVQDKLSRLTRRETNDHPPPPADDSSPWRRTSSPKVIRPRTKQVDLPRRSKRVTFDTENLRPGVGEVRHDQHLLKDVHDKVTPACKHERLPLKRLDRVEVYGGLPR